MFDVMYTDMKNERIDCLIDVNCIPRIGELVIFRYDKSQYYQVTCVIYPLYDNNDGKQTVIVKCKKV